MQNTQLPLICLSDQPDPQIEDVINKIDTKFQLKVFNNQKDFHKYLQSNLAVIISDLRHIDWISKNSNDIKQNILTILINNNEPDSEISNLIFDMIRPPVNKSKLLRSLLNAHTQLQLKLEIQKLQSTLKLENKRLFELNNIGVALSAERDLDKLLELILLKSREITHADAGSLYLVETKEGTSADENNYLANKQLRFKLAHCDSVTVGFAEFVMPIEKKSIAGYVALTGNPITIEDVYNIDENCEYTHNKSFDESVNYRTTSMLVIPMRNRKDELLGVLQLINRKRKWETILNSPEIVAKEVIPFDDNCMELASSLASQAGISIENNRLYGEIKNLFEGFIKASVHAIEERDPTTSGHSERVAILTTQLAEKVDSIDKGRFKNCKFSRNDIQLLNYASLLHDFGKIGVRENVLVKAKKLFPYELSLIKTRFKLFQKLNELSYSKQKIDSIIHKDKDVAMAYIRKFNEHTKEYKTVLDQYLESIIESNEPKILKESGFEMLNEIGKITHQENGVIQKLLTEEERIRLSIPKGSLSDEERRQIESHVTHTYNFLIRIPWSSELKEIPNIAAAHHEKLDGSGYPHGLKEKEIPIQSKIMAISDIYDALTARDRPYKRAVPVEKALQILQWEVNDGKLDADLLKIFIDAKLFDLVQKSE